MPLFQALMAFRGGLVPFTQQVLNGKAQFFLCQTYGVGQICGDPILHENCNCRRSISFNQN